MHRNPVGVVKFINSSSGLSNLTRAFSFCRALSEVILLRARSSWSKSAEESDSQTGRADGEAMLSSNKDSSRGGR